MGDRDVKGVSSIFKVIRSDSALTRMFPIYDFIVVYYVLKKRIKTFLYYESIKWQLKTRPTNECRCDERLKTETEESTRLGYSGLLGETKHLKIKTRLKDEKFTSVMGEYVFLKW